MFPAELNLLSCADSALTDLTDVIPINSLFSQLWRTPEALFDQFTDIFHAIIVNSGSGVR